jgi:hypothetical protein
LLFFRPAIETFFTQDEVFDVAPLLVQFWESWWVVSPHSISSHGIREEMGTQRLNRSIVLPMGYGTARLRVDRYVFDASAAIKSWSNRELLKPRPVCRSPSAEASYDE